MGEELDLNWSGMLTIGNVQQVADRLLKLLGGKRYAFLALSESNSSKIDIQTGQTLDHAGFSDGNPVRVYIDDREKPPRFAMLNVNEYNWQWGFTTKLTEDVHDPMFNNPYLIFCPNKVIIMHRSADGTLLTWIVTIEGAV